MIGDAALGIWMDVGADGLDDFNAWYRRQHLPERLSVPGFLRGRRYESSGAGPRYFTLYETADAAVLSSPPYLERLNAPTDWTRRALPLVRRMVRNAYRRVATIGPDARADGLVTVRIQPHSGRGPYIRASLVGDAVGALSALGVVAAAVYETETAGTSVITEERKIVGGDVTRCAAVPRALRAGRRREARHHRHALARLGHAPRRRRHRRRLPSAVRPHVAAVDPRVAWLH